MEPADFKWFVTAFLADALVDVFFEDDEDALLVVVFVVVDAFELAGEAAFFFSPMPLSRLKPSTAPVTEFLMRLTPLPTATVPLSMALAVASVAAAWDLAAVVDT